MPLKKRKEFLKKKNTNHYQYAIIFVGMFTPKITEYLTASTLMRIVVKFSVVNW